MKKLNLLIKLFFILFFILICTVHIPETRAESLSLSVDPPILHVEAVPPAEVRTPITVSNKSKDTVNLKIVFKPFKSSGEENGEIEYYDDYVMTTSSGQGILKKVQLVDEDNYEVNSLVLGPQREKKLFLRISLPKDEQLQDYYFSVIFLSVPEKGISNQAPAGISEEDNFSTAQGGIAANVLLSIGPADAAKGEIDEFSAPWYLESGPVPFTVKVKNDGAHVITPSGVIMIKNMYGQTVGKVDIPPANILSGTIRSLEDSNQLGNATIAAQLNSYIDTNLMKRPKLQSPVAFWPENFLLGFYTATLSISLSDKGPVLTHTTHFIALPLTFLIGTILAVIMIVVIYLRVRKKLKS